MNLQKTLKNLKLNENNISMLLGAAVIVVIGFLVVNYFRSLEQGTTSTVGTTTEENQIKLPTKYTVKSGDTLWSIAEKFYQSGYNWVDIQKANKLSDASVISAGQELDIPDVSPKLLGSTNKKNEEATMSAKETETTKMTEVTPTEAPILSETYTVQKGDTLWAIAKRTYGDGFQWKKIATANKLKNPSVIHSGNVLTLPR